MIKFLKNVIIISSAIFLILSITIFAPPNKKDQSYLSAQIDKINRLKKSTQSSIILIGGSNLAFGFDSKTLKELLKYDVINMGLQGSLGFTFQIENIIPYLKKGDIVVLAAEYFQYLDNNCYGNGATPAKVIQATNPFLIFDLPLKNIRQALPYLVNASFMKIKNSITRSDTTDSQRFFFNSNGDFTGHLFLPDRVPKQLEKYRLSGDIKENVFEVIKYYKKKIEDRNCKFFITYQPFPRDVAELNIDLIESIDHKLRKNKLPIISYPDNYFFEKSMIFEYANHLNAKGRIIRTNKLAQDLLKKITPFVQE